MTKANITKIAATAILALGLGVGAIAHASDDEGSEHAAPAPGVMEQLRADLEAQGYEVRRIEMEDGLYEAYAMKDGQRFELYLDHNGNIVKEERE